MTKEFDHSMLTTKAMCSIMLREFGVRRDWARTTLPEMKAMIKRYPTEKLLAATKAIVERDGATYDESTWVRDVEESDAAHDNADGDAAHDNVSDANSQPIEGNITFERVRPAQRTEVHYEKPPANAAKVAAALAEMMAGLEGQVNPAQVEEISNRIFDAKLEGLRNWMVDFKKQVKDQIENNRPEPREIRVITERSDVTIEGIQHKHFEQLLRMCSARTLDNLGLNVWLYGPAGTGKTTAARNVAKALGLQFYCTGALLTKYDITGFIDANGKLIRSPFRDAWENGGVFLFDEIDGSDPRAVVSFNSALANGVMAFPDAMVERNANCVIIAAANTAGLGATSEFSGRLKMDAASLDRFVLLDWPIDEKVEASMSAHTEWVRTVQTIRAAVVRQGIKNVSITPRATLYGSSLLDAGMTIEQVKRAVLRKSMSDEQWTAINA